MIIVIAIIIIMNGASLFYGYVTFILLLLYIPYTVLSLFQNHHYHIPHPYQYHHYRHQHNYPRHHHSPDYHIILIFIYKKRVKL